MLSKGNKLDLTEFLDEFVKDCRGLKRHIDKVNDKEDLKLIEDVVIDMRVKFSAFEDSLFDMIHNERLQDAQD